MEAFRRRSYKWIKPVLFTLLGCVMLLGLAFITHELMKPTHTFELSASPVKTVKEPHAKALMIDTDSGLRSVKSGDILKVNGEVRKVIFVHRGDSGANDKVIVWYTDEREPDVMSNARFMSQMNETNFAVFHPDTPEHKELDRLFGKKVDEEFPSPKLEKSGPS